MTRVGRTTLRRLATSFGALAFGVLAARAAGANDELPFYYDRPITATELRGKTLRELEILRATIHAHAGLVFLEWRLRYYFARIATYRPGDYDVTHLSAVDEQNLRTLAAYESSIPRIELKQRWDSLLLEHRYAGGFSLLSRLDFSTDGSVVAVGPSIMGTRWPLSLYRTATGERVSTVSWARGNLYALRLVGNDLVVVSDYRALTGDWRALYPRRSVLIGARAQSDGHRDPPPFWACISPDGTNVVVESAGNVTTFDLNTGRRGSSLPLSPGPLMPSECTFTGARTAFVRGHQFGAGYILDFGSKHLVPLEVPPGNSFISPDGASLARWAETLASLDAKYRAQLTGTPARCHESLAGESCEVELWTLRGTRRRLRILPGSAGTALAAFSPDGTHLLTADWSGRLIHWNTATAARTLWRDRTRYQRFDTFADVLDRLDAPLTSPYLSDDQETPSRDAELDRVTALLFSPDSSHVMVAYLSGNLELRDARSGQPIAAFRGHRAWTDDDLWEITLLARNLGFPLDPVWPSVPEFVDPLKHLKALDGPLPPSVIGSASRARLRILRNAIIARRGGAFESSLLRSLFAGHAPSATYTPDRLTPIDRDNIMRIKRRERALGGSISDAALRAVLRRDAGPEAG